MARAGGGMSGRSYGALGCLAVVLLPLVLLSEWIDGRLTWLGAAATILACLLVLALPPLLAGRDDGG